MRQKEEEMAVTVDEEYTKSPFDNRHLSEEDKQEQQQGQS